MCEQGLSCWICQRNELQYSLLSNLDLGNPENIQEEMILRSVSRSRVWTFHFCNGPPVTNQPLKSPITQVKSLPFPCQWEDSQSKANTLETDPQVKVNDAFLSCPQNNLQSQVEWLTPIIPALGKVRQAVAVKSRQAWSTSQVPDQSQRSRALLLFCFTKAHRSSSGS